MGIVFFLIGFIFLLATGAAVAFDGLFFMETGLIEFASVSQVWTILLGEESLRSAVSTFAGMMGGRNWVDYGEAYLASPAVATPGALMVLFFLLAYLSRKPKIPQEEIDTLATSGSGSMGRRGGGRRP